MSIKKARIKIKSNKIVALFHDCSIERRLTCNGDIDCVRCPVRKECFIFYSDHFTEDQDLYVTRLGQIRQAVEYLKKAKRREVELKDGWWQQFITPDNG